MADGPDPAAQIRIIRIQYFGSHDPEEFPEVLLFRLLHHIDDCVGIVRNISRIDPVHIRSGIVDLIPETALRCDLMLLDLGELLQEIVLFPNSFPDVPDFLPAPERPFVDQDLLALGRERRIGGNNIVILDPPDLFREILDRPV